MLPLFHGTSTYHYAQMKASGFLSPRGERLSTWSEIPSRKHLVYFGSIHEQQIPHKSAYNAVDQVNNSIKPFFEARKTGSKTMIQSSDGSECHIITKPNGRINIVCDPGIPDISFDFKKDLAEVYLRLDNIDKYKKYMVRDEDEDWKWFTERSYYLKSESQLGITFCGRRTDWQLIIILDCIWYLFDKDAQVMDSVFSIVPSTVRSFYANNTIAFATSIDVNDLIPYTSEQFNKITNEISEKVSYACQESEELKLKEKFAEGRVSDDKLKEFIKTVQLPRLKTLLDTMHLSK